MKSETHLHHFGNGDNNCIICGAARSEVENAKLRAERDEARRFAELAAKQYNELLATCAENTAVTCAFCGTVYPAGTPRHGDGLLAEHIKMCSAHPMRVVEAERDEWRERAMRRMEEAEQAEATRDRLAAELGERRMCVNCGRTKPASEDRHEPLPECTGPDGHAACTFDMTPQGAWEHWRVQAHRLAAEVERLKARLHDALDADAAEQLAEMQTCGACAAVENGEAVSCSKHQAEAPTPAREEKPDA